MAEAEWKELEQLVAKIQQELAPQSVVTHNAKIRGHQSGVLRQVDVLVEQSIGQFQMRIAIDCKDYSTPADVKDVEEFHGLMTDIGANKGALVCPRGFTSTAKTRAKGLSVDLYSPVDTDPHKWQVKPTLPMICDFRSASIGFGLSFSEAAPFRTPIDFYEQLEVFDGDGGSLGTPVEIALKRWNAGEFPCEPGTHERIPLAPVPVTLVDNGYGRRLPVKLFLSLRVSQRIYFGHLPIVQMRGLKDEQTGQVVTNAFTTGHLDPQEVERDWKQLQLGEAPPVRPVMEVVGLDCYEIGPAGIG